MRSLKFIHIKMFAVFRCSEGKDPLLTQDSDKTETIFRVWDQNIDPGKSLNIFLLSPDFIGITFKYKKIRLLQL